MPRSPTDNLRPTDHILNTCSLHRLNSLTLSSHGERGRGHGSALDRKKVSSVHIDDIMILNIIDKLALRVMTPLCCLGNVIACH